MILSILKIIGLVLLVILCVLLALILLVLFVPVRYAAEFEYDDQSLRLDVKVTWLLSMIRCYAGLRNKDFFYKVKALFFSIIDSTRAPKEEKTTKKQSEYEKTPPQDNEKAGENEAKRENKTVQNVKASDNTENEPAREPTQENAEPEQKDETSRESVKQEPVPEEKPISGSEKKQKKQGKKFRFPFKIMHPADIYDKIVRTLMDVSRKIDKICAQIVSEENRETVLFVLAQIKKLLYHIRPRKHGIYLKLGMKDPALTGQIMGAYSVLNSVFGMNFILEPVFDYEVLETRGYVKGHIRVISLLIIAIRLYRNKVIRKLIRRK